MAARKTGRAARTRDGRWQPIVTMPDGKIRRLNPCKRGASQAFAKERSRHWQEKIDAGEAVGLDEPAKPPEPAESCDTWLGVWVKDRVARGYTTTGEAHYRVHIVESIGDKHIRDWTRDDMRKLSRDLDTKVQVGRIAWKTAWNVWGTATKMCGDAAESKRDDIKCRDDNPATGVCGPDRGPDKGKQFLYPSEFCRFVECQDVPLRWRRIVAVAVCTYMRDAELRALECEDVDLEHGTIHVTKALCKKTGEIKDTKGRRRRYVPIEPAVAPLLGALAHEAGERGRILPDFPSERDMARGLRRWLLKAHVTRRELHHASPTTVPLTFHDLRATGVTWTAVRGDEPLKIQHRAGHKDFETTQRYVRLAEMLCDGFGEVFPRLPAELYERSDDGSDAPKRSHEVITASQVVEIRRGGRDSNPRPPA